eukprot:g8494.t1
MADRLHLPISNKRVEDILMWRDVRLSGIIFGGLTLAYLVLEWSGYSIMCLTTYAVFALLTGLLIWHYAAPFVKMNPPIPTLISNGITEEEAKKAVEKAVPYANRLLATANTVITGKDLLLSAKVLGVLYVVARVSAMISLFTLAYFGVLVAFVAPKVYEMRKDQIDGYIAIAMEKLKEYYKQVESAMKKIPSAKTTPAKKVE